MPPKHKKGRGPGGEYFETDRKTDIEQELEEYLGGAIFSGDEDPFTDKVVAKLKEYIKNSPMSTNSIYRIEELIPQTRNLRVGSRFYRRISSWSKSQKAVLEMANDLPNGNPADAIILAMVNPHAINVEGYSYFYYQRESLSCGNLEVINIRNIKIDDDTTVPYVVVKQVSI